MSQARVFPLGSPTISIQCYPPTIRREPGISEFGKARAVMRLSHPQTTSPNPCNKSFVAPIKQKITTLLLQTTLRQSPCGRGGPSERTLFAIRLDSQTNHKQEKMRGERGERFNRYGILAVNEQREHRVVYQLGSSQDPKNWRGLCERRPHNLDKEKLYVEVIKRRKKDYSLKKGPSTGEGGDALPLHCLPFPYSITVLPASQPSVTTMAAQPQDRGQAVAIHPPIHPSIQLASCFLLLDPFPESGRPVAHCLLFPHTFWALVFVSTADWPGLFLSHAFFALHPHSVRLPNLLTGFLHIICIKASCF